MEGCVFCQIVKGEIKSRNELEDENFLVFHDARPKAPVHLLVVPKVHVELGDDLGKDSVKLGQIFEVAKTAAKKTGVLATGYKLIMNCGRGGGQVIDHLHLHLLGGWSAGEKKELPE